MTQKDSLSFERGSKAGFLIALGVVYGDIGTSPLYTMQALVRGQGGIGAVNKEFILGSISLIIWTLTIITTIKYVLIALKADNDHEGGIFFLIYPCEKKSQMAHHSCYDWWSNFASRWGVDASCNSHFCYRRFTKCSVVGNLYQDESIVIATSLTILTVLFSIQRFGTGFVGKVFGPVMFIWFLFLGLVGLNKYYHLSRSF